MTKKILCAVDDFDTSRQAIVQAAELSAKTGSPLVLCTVNALTGGLRGPPIYMRDESAVEETLDASYKLASEHGAKKISKTELKGREIATSVVIYAENNQVDHIFTGIGDRHGLSHLLHHSVASEIASRAHCTVTIAR
jgi:nucleotide-binding universal stress UspA family protein